MLARVSRQTPRDETPSLPILSKFPKLRVYQVFVRSIKYFLTEIEAVYSGIWRFQYEKNKMWRS